MKSNEMEAAGAKRRTPAPGAVRLLASVIIVLGLQASVLAQDSSGTQAEVFDWIAGSVGLHENYDDNFLEYSGNEIRQFNEGTKPLKYLVTNTRDVVTNLRTRVSLAPPFFSGEFRTFVRAKLNRYWNRTNSFRAYTSWGLELKQFLWEKSWTAFQFNSLPNYYIRNLQYRRYLHPTRLPSQYIPEELSKRSYALEFGRRITSKLSVALHYVQERATYNAAFYERSNTARDYAVETDYRFSRWVKGGVDIAFSEVWAHGRDNFENPVFDSLSDISSRSVRVMLGSTVNLKPIIGIPLEVQPEFVYEYQAYLSGKPGDAFHFGRIDRYSKFSLELRYPLLRRLECSAAYSWEENKTNLGETGDAGSYQEHRIGLGLEYSF